MPSSINSDLALEWNTLQNNIEQYEKSGLHIKLTSIVLCVVGLGLMHQAILTSVLLGVLWIQEGIFRTFQSRLVERILLIEEAMKQVEQDQPNGPLAYQLYSEWMAKRTGITGLLQEYTLSMLRPTVAFPYAVLILVNLASLIACIRRPLFF